ncbi:hypothetical protein ACHAPQ_008584 [Fusarium lateritium]
MSSKQAPVVQTVPLKSGPRTMKLSECPYSKNLAAPSQMNSVFRETSSTIPQKMLPAFPDPALDIADNYDVTALATAIASNKFRSLAAVIAFCERAMIAH